MSYLGVKVGELLHHWERQSTEEGEQAGSGDQSIPTAILFTWGKRLSTKRAYSLSYRWSKRASAASRNTQPLANGSDIF